MKNEAATGSEKLLRNGISCDEHGMPDKPKVRVHRWKRHLASGAAVLSICLMAPKLADGQSLGVFSAIFSSIQNDIGVSLSSINRMAEQMRTLYERTVAPLSAINQARGFVVNSIASYRGRMNQIFYTPFASAVTSGPRRFENVLHSRASTDIPDLQASFAANFGAVPTVHAASPQDRVMMDIDDALGQENLKTTLIADQGADAILDTANQMESQVAVSSPGSNPFLTAQAQVANIRCQAYLQKMLAAELRQEAGRIAHDDVLLKRRTTATGGINSLVSGALTSR